MKRELNWIFADFPNPVLIWVSDAVYIKFRKKQLKPGHRLLYRRFNDSGLKTLSAVVKFADGKKLELTNQ